MAVSPSTKLIRKSESVLDVRICHLSGCAFFERTQLPSGEWVASCKASIYKAEIPLQPLMEEIARNQDPVPGIGASDNPFLVRLLMSPSCVRPECGVAQIAYQERVLVVDEAEVESPLFQK